MAQRDVGQLGDGPRHLHARRAGADHHEGEEAPSRLGVAGLLGVLEGLQDAAADAGGVVDILEARRDLSHSVMAEIGVPRAGGQHQHVIGDLAIFHFHDTALRSTPVTRPRITRTFEALRRIERMGWAICAGDRPAVAT